MNHDASELGILIDVEGDRRVRVIVSPNGMLTLQREYKIFIDESVDPPAKRIDWLVDPESGIVVHDVDALLAAILELREKE